MASIPVNNNLKALANTVSQTAGTPNSQNPYANAANAKQEDALQDSFGAVMNRVNTQTAQKANTQKTDRTDGVGAAKTVVKVSATVDTQSMSGGVTTAKNSVKSVAKDNTADDKAAVQDGETVNETSKDSVTQDVSDETKEAVSEAGEELVEEVAGEMGITPEEVEEAMEVLGLTAVQLLDPANMQKLLMAITGNEDQFSIITDAELYGHLQNLLNTVSAALDELQTELGISENELGEIIADMAVVENPSEESEIPEDLLTQPETGDVNLEGMKDYAVTVHKDGETVEVKVTVDDASGGESVQEEVAVQADAQPKNDAKSGNRDSFGEHKGEGNPSGNLMMQTPAQQPGVNDISVQQPVMERFVSTEDIMNQIMEYMKINLKADVQELELQLHPASLGNVHVQIASKDGMISAQFTAQNEVVKAAIETQLIQLKEQFEEQGIKVDAVEVTVANYQFEQNFSGNEEHPGEKQGSGKKSRRNINLNDLDADDMPEDMDDAERIATEMMARNGNTIDYSA